MSEIISCTNLNKTYVDGTNKVPVLKDVNFTINPGDRIAIVGPSGSGKSTFLHLLGGLDFPTSGYVAIHGKEWKSLSEKERCKLRNENLGFIYQFHHLLPEFTALENITMPLLLNNVDTKEAKERAHKILEEVGLAERKTHKPSQLSGGERQRVAIARALVHRPKCVFADEPTGNLDTNTASNIFKMLLELNENYDTALIVVTHDQELAKKMDKTISLRAGEIV